MTKMWKRIGLPALVGALALWGAQPLHASLVYYTIDANTSALTGTSGYLEFQFNPGVAPVDPAFADVEYVVSDGTLLTPATDIGDVSGALPAIVQINNTDLTNDHAEGFTYGTSFRVYVVMSVPVVSGSAFSGSSFYLTLDDGSFTPLIAAGPLVEIDLDSNGNPTVINNSPNSEAMVNNGTPEPSSGWMLLAAGLALFAALCISRMRKTHFGPQINTDEHR
jgi:hypothetical protein